MKIIKTITKLVEKICVVLFITMSITTFFQVIARYVFGKAQFWAEELPMFAMVWMVFLGAAISVSQKSHTRIEFFLNLLPIQIRKWVNILNNLICMAFVIFTVYYSIDVNILTMKNLSVALRIPMGFIYGSLTVGGILMLVYFALLIYFQINNIDIEKEMLKW